MAVDSLATCGRGMPTDGSTAVAQETYWFYPAREATRVTGRGPPGQSGPPSRGDPAPPADTRVGFSRGVTGTRRAAGLRPARRRHRTTRCSGRPAPDDVTAGVDALCGAVRR
jgi:hypothetical protein